MIHPTCMILCHWPVDESHRSASDQARFAKMCWETAQSVNRLRPITNVGIVVPEPTVVLIGLTRLADAVLWNGWPSVSLGHCSDPRRVVGDGRDIRAWRRPA